MDFIQVNIPATDQEVDNILKELCEEFDTTLTMKDVKADLAKRPKMAKFLETHTKQHKYFFCIKKCSGCEYCTEKRYTEKELHFLPVPITTDEEHYQPFEVSYFHELIVVVKVWLHIHMF